jgi:phospholipid/cholesterol/gamma-HCH transport system substrate-binding protein
MMKTAQMERLVGIFVLLGIACISYFALQFGSVQWRALDTYTVEARFTNASGLVLGSQVAIAGVTVGSVTGLKLGKDFSALVEFKLRKDVQLPSDSIASIRGHGLLGDKYISLAAGSAEDVLPAGGRLTETESSLDLESLLSRFAFGAVQSEKKTTPEK